MKKTSILFLALAMVFGVNEALSQLQANPNNFSHYYFYRMTGTSARAYTANTTDTLPNGSLNNWFAASTTTLRAGGSFAGIRFINNDSVYAYIYVDAKYGTEWANAVYTDSVEVAVPDTVEILLRGVATERLGGAISRNIRVRVNFQNVTQGTSSATYQADYIWKP